MDESTSDVTLLTGFIFDVLDEYKGMKKVCAPAFDMARDLDPRRQDAWCAMTLYNDICTWIEQNIGAASIRKAGIEIGNRVFDTVVKVNKMTQAEATPLAMMQALKWAASTMIRDPKGRGWEIVSSADGRIVMRRTQTFNCTMQEGLLLSLVERTKVDAADVAHDKCTKQGDEFCEYTLTWL